MSLVRGCVAVALLSIPSAALAQSNSDIEYRDIELEGADALEYRVFFEAQWHEYDNLDLRKLDETSDQAILDSDDRSSFAFTGIALELGYRVDDHTRLVVGASHRGLWGADQLGGISRFGGWIYFNAAYLEYTLGSGDTSTRFMLGRQFFKIGGIPGDEYAFLDVIDGLRIDQSLGGIGTLTLIPIEVPSLASANDHAAFIDYIGQSPNPVFGFNGDTITRRHGLVLTLDGLVDMLDARAYAFYTDIGAVGTGADITYQGTLGNFADNDWVANFGVRASAEVGPVVPFASLDVSTGIDRKELVANDVDTNGVAWHLGVALPADEGLTGMVSYFDTLGPAYGEDGLQYSHGYVGMKASQVGGVVTDRFMGWHPTPYVGLMGIDTSPHDIDRKSGTRSIHAEVGYALPEVVSVGVGYWFLQDTGISFLDFGTLDTEIDPPYGYSREEFKAEQRLGEVLGHEIDLNVTVPLTDKLSVRGAGGVFLPGPFYELETARVAGTALGSADPAMAWNGNISTALRF